MNKIIITLSFVLSFFVLTDVSNAAHCSGGHKEVKETSETTSEESKKDKSN